MADRSRDWKLYGWKDTLPRREAMLLTGGTQKHCREEAALYRRGGWYVGHYLGNRPSSVVLTGAAGTIIL